jgi:hypothetical protein
MNRMSVSRFCGICVAALLAVSCSQQGPAGTGPDASASSGGATASGGRSGTGGATSSGGSTGTGGTAIGSGGANVPDGGTAGATATGGRTGTGGASNTGGVTGTGGAVLTPASIVPMLDGFLWVGTCSSGGVGLDCMILGTNQSTCSSATTIPFEQRGAFLTTPLAVGGTTGTRYTINFEVRGVAGGKYYVNGTRDPQRPTILSEGAAANDGWYVGGTPNTGLWNTYEIHVTPPVPGAALSAANDNVYYMNWFPTTSGLGDGRHETMVWGFTASFPVLGGGTITMVIHDSNCNGQQNCGQTVEGQNVCSAPRAVDLTGMSPPPPASFVQQPAFTQNGFHPQWLFFDVKTVTSP